MAMKLRSARARRAALVLALFAALSSVWFSLRTYHSFVLLRSAYHVGMPQSSSVRGWMTIGYVATIYRVPEILLIARLGLPLDISSDTSLKSLAERERISPFQYVQRVQQSIAKIASIAPRVALLGGKSWFQVCLRTKAVADGQYCAGR
jgi:hypothetical protein